VLTVAVILARGGSKGIPLKNLQEVNSKPLISRAVENALRSECFTTVYVSTDHEAIAHEARMSGATVLWRPEELAVDSSGSEEVLVHHLSNELDAGLETVCMVQCTSPFIGPKALQSAKKLLGDGSLDSVFSGRIDHTFRWVPIGGNTWAPVDHSKLSRPRRQDLPLSVIETGAFYYFRVSSFLQERNRFCGNTGVVLVDGVECLEIDEFDDLRTANQLAPLWDKKAGEK
jgi:N-acylneuraminate cytidylyltransferase